MRHHASRAPLPEPEVLTPQEFHFGEFSLDQSSYRLRRNGRALRLEKLPMELLILLVRRHGELISREDIAASLWDKDVFVDVDHSINTAVRKIRLVLRDDPEKPRFVETVIGKGYRFAAPVTTNGTSRVESLASDPRAEVPVIPSIPPADPAAVPIPAVPEKPKQSTPVLAVLLTGAVVLAVFAAGFFLYRGRYSKTRAGQATIRSIAVLPLKNLSGDPSQEYLADGLTEALIGRLSRIHDLRVISRTSVMRFKNAQLSAPEIANALHVDALVEGSVIRDGTRIRVNAQLIRAATDEHFWSEAYDRELRDMLSLESDVAQAIAGKVEVTVTGKEHERLRAVRPVAPEVYESYLKGRFALDNQGDTRAGVEESIAYFQDAITKDPQFAPGYVGLAQAYDEFSTIFIGAPPEDARAKELQAADRALELDPDLAEAHVLIADVNQKHWHWAEAESGYKRALEIKPSDATAYAGMAQWLACQNRMDEALKWAEKGRELDPLAVPGVEIAWMLFFARRYDDAVHELNSTLALKPDDASALWLLGFVLMSQEHADQAVPALEKAVALSHGSPGMAGVLAAAYGQAGRKRDGLRVLADLRKRRQESYAPAGALVNGYLGLGQYDDAFYWLNQAYDEHSNLLQFLLVHPAFDPIRTDPRFTDLVHRVGLDKSY